MVYAKDIDAVLPQTQCQECGYQGCLPYAKAISEGKDTINHCKPGGEKTLQKLADLLALDPAPYLAQVCADYKPESSVRIDYDRCIGCTKCIQVCPVDAIVGAPKHMHSVMENVCTGCDLCLAVCPVDCMIAYPIKPRDTQRQVEFAKESRQYYQKRQQRLEKQVQLQQLRYQQAKRWVDKQTT